MTQLSEFKRVWQEASDDLTIDEIGKEEVRVLIGNRSATLKKQILKRISTEVMTYVVIALFIVCTVFLGGFGSGRTFLIGALAFLVVVPSLAVLAYKEYALRTLSMTGTLRESVSSLINAIDSTASLYLIAYVVSIIVSLGSIEILLISSKGWSVTTIVSIVVAVAFAVWCYLSGSRYAAGMFRKYRSELISVLRELEN